MTTTEVPPSEAEIMAALHARLAYLQPLKDEHDRLQIAMTSLNGAGIKPAPEPEPTPKHGKLPLEPNRPSGDMPKPKAKPRPRLSRGQTAARKAQADERRDAFHQFLREHPGTWTSHDLAPILGIRANQMGPLLGRAMQRGEIVHVDDHHIPEEKRSIKIFRRAGEFAQASDSPPAESEPSGVQSF